MNKQERHAVSVGLFTAIFIGIVVGVILFLRGTLNSDKKLNVVFDNAYGVQKGEQVHMAGVRIGQVDAVSLRSDNRALMLLGIRREFAVPEGSHIRIKSGILGNSRTIIIEPAESNRYMLDGATVQGDSTEPIDEALAETKKLVQQGQELVASVQKITGDPEIQTGLRDTLRNTVAITENLKKATESLPKLQSQAAGILSETRATIASGQRVTYQVELLAKDSRQIASDARKLVATLDSTLLSSKDQLIELLDTANNTALALSGLLDTLKETVSGAGLKEGVNKVFANADAATKNITLATEKLVSIADKMDKMADNIAKLSGDEGITNDIKSTVNNLKETSASIRNLAARVEGVRLPWEKNRPAPTPTPAPGQPTPTVPIPTVPAPPARPSYFSDRSLLEPGLAFDATYDTTLERLTTDVGYTLLSGRNGFYRLGLADATEGNRLNLQFGRSDAAPVSFGYRYGLFAGKLGVGFDYRPGPFDLRLDMYDPNRFQVDARMRVFINRNTAITTGIRSIGKDNRPTVGLQFLR